MSLALAAVFLSMAFVLGVLVAVSERAERPPAWVEGQLTYMLWAPLIVCLLTLGIGELVQLAAAFGETRFGVLEIGITVVSLTVATAVARFSGIGRKLREYEARELEQARIVTVAGGPASHEPTTPKAA